MAFAAFGGMEGDVRYTAYVDPDYWQGEDGTESLHEPLVAGSTLCDAGLVNAKSPDIERERTSRQKEKKKAPFLVR